MQSPYLNDFLKNVGDAVHSINTIVVGLNSIKNGTYEKPDDLTITWKTSDNSFSSTRARQFALKSSLIYIEDSLAIYLKDCRTLTENEILKSILGRTNPQFIESQVELFRFNYPNTFHLFDNKNVKTKSADEKEFLYKHISSEDRLRALDEFFNFELKYWIPCVVLLLKWRNKIAHRKSAGKLLPNDIKILEVNSTLIKDNHANIDINKTISNYENNEMTLKDITTFIAITIRFARAIDFQIFKSVNNIKIIEEYVKRKNLIPDYNSIINLKNQKVRKRKFSNFIITNISHLDSASIEYLYQDFNVEIVLNSNNTTAN